MDLSKIELIFPCPFCKKKDQLKLKIHPTQNTGMIQCESCGCSVLGNIFRDSEGEFSPEELLKIGVEDLVDRFNLGEFNK